MMDEILEQIALDPWGRLVLHHVATCGLRNCYLFLLVSARLSGVLIVAPCLITINVPLPARIALVVLLSLIVAPTLSTVGTEGDAVVQASHQALPSIPLPATTADLACVICTEIGLGGVFGTGLIAVFCGLRLAGEWLDRHCGLGMGTVMNPAWMAGESACGSMTLWLGIVAFLLIEPVGGQLMVLRAMLHSFDAVPVGASSSISGTQLLNGLVQESIVLGLRISMPLVATMILVDLAFAIAGRNTTIAVSSSCYAIRLGVGLFVLAMTMTTIPDAIAMTLETAIQWLQATWN